MAAFPLSDVSSLLLEEDDAAAGIGLSVGTSGAGAGSAAFTGVRLRRVVLRRRLLDDTPALPPVGSAGVAAGSGLADSLDVSLGAGSWRSNSTLPLGGGTCSCAAGAGALWAEAPPPSRASSSKARDVGRERIRKVDLGRFTTQALYVVWTALEPVRQPPVVPWHGGADVPPRTSPLLPRPTRSATAPRPPWVP